MSAWSRRCSRYSLLELTPLQFQAQILNLWIGSDTGLGDITSSWLGEFSPFLLWFCGVLRQICTLWWLVCCEERASKRANLGIFTFNVVQGCLRTTVEPRILQVRRASSSLLGIMVRSLYEVTHTWQELTCSLLDFSFCRNCRPDFSSLTSLRSSSRPLFSTMPLRASQIIV